MAYLFTLDGGYLNFLLYLCKNNKNSPIRASILSLLYL